MSREGGEGSEGKSDFQLSTPATVQCGTIQHGFPRFLRSLRLLRGTLSVFKCMDSDNRWSSRSGAEHRSVFLRQGRGEWRRWKTPYRRSFWKPGRPVSQERGAFQGREVSLSKLSGVLQPESIAVSANTTSRRRVVRAGAFIGRGKFSREEPRRLPSLP